MLSWFTWWKSAVILPRLRLKYSRPARMAGASMVKALLKPCWLMMTSSAFFFQMFEASTYGDMFVEFCGYDITEKWWLVDDDDDDGDDDDDDDD